MNTKTLSETSPGFAGFVSRNLRRLTFALAPLALAAASFGCKDHLGKDAQNIDLLALLQASGRSNQNSCSPGNLYPYGNQGTSSINRMVATTTSNTILVLDQDKNSGTVYNTINPISGNCSTLGGAVWVDNNNLFVVCSGSSSGIMILVDLSAASMASTFPDNSLATFGSQVNLDFDYVSRFILAANPYSSKVIKFDNATTAYTISPGTFTGLNRITLAQLDKAYSSSGGDKNKATVYSSYGSGVAYGNLLSSNYLLGNVSALAAIQNSLTNDVWYDCPGDQKILLAMNPSNYLVALNINGNDINNLAHSHVATWTTSPASNQVSQIKVYGNKLYIISSGINGSSDGVMVASMEDIKAGIDPFTSSKSKFILDSSFSTPLEGWINPRAGTAGQMQVTNGGGTNKITVIDLDTDTVVGVKNVGFPTRHLGGTPFR